MILSTGNKLYRRRTKEGFSFVEVMVAVAVLSFGIVLIYKAFFISLNYVRHVQYRLQANLLLENRIADIERILKEKGEIPISQQKDKESMVIGGRRVDLNYVLTLRTVDDLNNIYELTVSFSWLEGQRRIELSRSAYIANFKKSGNI